MFISNASVHCAVENKYSLFTLYVVVASCRGGTDDKVITKSGGMFGKHWPFKAAYEDQIQFVQRMQKIAATITRVATPQHHGSLDLPGAFSGSQLHELDSRLLQWVQPSRRTWHLTQSNYER